jgi:hypothetical protein
MSWEPMLVEVQIPVFVQPLVCAGCDAETLPTIHRVERDQSRGGHPGAPLIAYGHSYPGGWDSFSFGSLRGVLCPACGARISAAVIPLLNRSGVTKSAGGSEPGEGGADR